MTMELQTDDFLTARDLDAVLALVLNLTAEVIELQERVRALDGSVETSSDDLQERIDELVARVARPLQASGDLL